MGGGFNNSNWMAAIDNKGEVLVLHDKTQMKLVPKDYPMEVKRQIEADGTIHLKKHKDLYSTVHILTGHKFVDHSYFQIGHLCPDEILELALDE